MGQECLPRVGSGLDTGERHGETDEIFSCTLGVLGAGDVESADDLASDALAYDEDAARDDVSVGVAPSVDLELDAGVELIKALAGADEDGAAVAGYCRGRRHLRNGGHTLTILPCFWSQKESAFGFGEFGSIPEGFEFAGGELFEGARAGGFHGVEAAAKFCVGIAQGEFGIDLQVTGEIYGRKQQIAQFFGDGLRVVRRARHSASISAVSSRSLSMRPETSGQSKPDFAALEPSLAASESAGMERGTASRRPSVCVHRMPDGRIAPAS